MSDLADQTKLPEPAARELPEGAAFKRVIEARRRRGAIWRGIFFSSTVIGLIALVMLLFNVVNSSFGLVALQNEVNPATLAGGRPLETLSKDELVTILQDNVSKGLFNRLNRDQPFAERTQTDVLALVLERVVNQEIVDTWPLTESLFNRAEIEAQVARERQEAAEDDAEVTLEWRSWLDRDFLINPMSSEPAVAGVRTALLGSLWMILITIVIAFPIGVGAAVYLEEYATDNRFNRIIQTNISNLAGVPSIIYGMLGLAIFVRALEPITSGRIFGVENSNGRTILSAALTLALLILPLIIINGQEAIRAVPLSLRQASYALGATKWQTVWNHVLPNALVGIMTGTILAMSRAIGETAPLIVVGASTFIAVDPDGPFARFTALPIQIFNWTSQPNDQFRNIAAAAIIVLLIMLLTLNSIAILLRNRFGRSY
jgi:phosphate transport system permease protein